MTSTSMPSVLLGAKTGAGRKRRRASVAGLALGLCVLSFSVPLTNALAGENAPLRLCADPDNLPFTSDKAENPGIYRELGKAIAQELNRPLTENWYRTNFGKRATRVTLLAKQCDFFIGLPAESDFMGPALIFSKPFMKAGYALLIKKPGTVSSWADLSGKAVAVQLNSSPQQLMASRDSIRMVTELSPEDTVKAVANGEADAAFVWGPSAGYLNKTLYSGNFTIIPVDGPGMQWPVAIAFAKRDVALRDAVNGVLEKLGPKIAGLKEKYGIPADEPVTLPEIAALAKAAEAPREQAAEPAKAEIPAPAPAAASQAVQSAAEAASQAPASPAAASAPSGEGAPASAESASLTPPAAEGEDRVREGKEVFNGTCAHCHGPDAIQAERKINLRLLHHRYGLGMEDMFFKTVTNGRPSKGMPSWKDVFTQDQFVSIFAFLKTVQEDQ